MVNGMNVPVTIQVALSQPVVFLRRLKNAMTNPTAPIKIHSTSTTPGSGQSGVSLIFSWLR
jgi:uncharacterized protein involved in outer membrane biogenesis